MSENTQSETGAPLTKKQFEKQIREITPALTAFSLRLTKNPQDAEDLVQNTFKKIWENLHRFDSRKEMRPWAFKIMKNSFIGYCRNKRCRPQTLPFSEDKEADSRSGKLHPDRISSLHDLSASSYELVLDAAKAFESLPTARRFAFMEVALRGEAGEDVAAQRGVGVNTIYTTVLKARIDMRDALDLVPPGSARKSKAIATQP